jgi:hypothetical protein
MKKLTTFFALVILALSSSCGKKAPAKPESDNFQQYTWSEPMRAEQNFSESQRQIGVEVCQALRSKRELFTTFADRTIEFPFAISKQTCSRGASRFVSNSWLRVERAGNFRYEPMSSSTEMIEDVLTDQHAKLESICSSLIAGGNPLNTFGSGNLRSQVAFFTRNNERYVQISEFSSSTGRFMPYLIDLTRVAVAATASNRNHWGMERERILYRPCATGGTQSLLQTWQ